MLKYRSVSFKNHPVLGDLHLDFVGRNGRAVDTVIIAGENGTGKSTIMNTLYAFVSGTGDAIASPMHIEMEDDDGIINLEFYHKQLGNNLAGFVREDSHSEEFIASSSYRNRRPMSAIYSDVDINFKSHPLSSVTSLTLDDQYQSRRSTSNLPTEINQLFIDIQALDDADFANAARSAKPKTMVADLNPDQRMPRFTNAFSLLFDDLRYDRIDNVNGYKQILFKKWDKDIPIESLSSGEKQIVYRGGFLLRDAEALSGAFVFIDEPEISLHPIWQERIMDYYKAIFTNADGMQTSQIICVTHSPFIIHNETRKDDKVIILQRNESGALKVLEKPEYL